MRELKRSNDIVYLNAVEAFLRSAGFSPVILDGNISAVEGSIGAFPRRLMVPEDEGAGAARALADFDDAHG